MLLNIFFYETHLSLSCEFHVRFLKASSLNESKAAEKWASYMDWWKENDGSKLRDVSPFSSFTGG